MLLLLIISLSGCLGRILIEYKESNVNVIFGIDTKNPRITIAEDRPVTAYFIQISEKLKKTITWSISNNSHPPLHIIYSGKDLQPDTRYLLTYKTQSPLQTTTSQTLEFHTGLLGSPFQGIWIGSNEINMNQLRTEFSIPMEFLEATAFVCGLGYHEIYVNGHIVDPNRKLDPAYLTYEIRTLYSTFDFSDYLVVGANAIGVMLGNGWYSQGQVGGPPRPYGPVKLMFQLNVKLVNGTVVQVISDESWMGREGPLVHDSVYHGEIYDARREREGWSNVGFVDKSSKWMPVSQLPSPGGVLSPQMMEPIRIQGYLKAIHIPVPNIFYNVFDFGQNFAGWVRIRVTGARGTILIIQYTEVLQANGVVSIDDLLGAAQRDQYVLKGDPNGEVYEPRFTVHGFRYIEIFGFKEDIPSSDIIGVVVHSYAPPVGSFSTNNPIINQIQSNILWSQKSNIMSIPTDCPQRNERKGWLGDSSLSVDEALYNFYLPLFYENWIQDIQDVQNTTGGNVPDTVPFCWGSLDADPNWGTAFPTITYSLFDHYGDISILQKHYLNLKLWVDYLTRRAQQSGLKNMYFEFADWENPTPPAASGSLVSSSAYIVDVLHLSQIAYLIGNQTDYAYYNQLFQKLLNEFHVAFYNPSINGYGSGVQTENVLALAIGAVPSNLSSIVVQSLVEDIRKNNFHFTTGIIGTRYLFPTLSKFGHHDLAIAIATGITYPSYGWTFNNPYQNATTLWETWDAPLKFSSQNHVMFGSIGAWFWRYLAGIKPNAMKIIEVSPAPVSSNSPILEVSASYQSLRGKIEVNWIRSTYHYQLHVEVPGPSYSKVTIPKHDQNYAYLKEGGVLIANFEKTVVMTSQSILNVSQNDGTIEILVQPGSYNFIAEI
eukprot:TRINITY_DN2557_c0_g1_i1.p1 TRINITY_DN2557_c0_g1~~TRINITY_DN2557_c0_g1_i1.p1  ORF type:complete len:882 (+),score=202.33 TRINITY_DN2557_c0_g1_i1:42-2687(+)